MPDEYKVNEQDNAPQKEPQGATGAAGPMGKPCDKEIITFSTGEYAYICDTLQRLESVMQRLQAGAAKHMTPPAPAPAPPAPAPQEDKKQEDKKGNGLYF